MPAVSISLALNDDMHQATIAANAPSAGAVEIRIANGVGHAEARQVLQRLLSRVMTDGMKGT